MENKLNTEGWSKEKLEAYEQAQSKLKLEELLRKSTSDITHDEMMFVLENMDLESLFNAAAKRQNEKIINLIDEQKN